MKRLRGELEENHSQLEKAQAESVRMRDEERRKLQQDITELTAQNSSLKFDNERMLGEVGWVWDVLHIARALGCRGNLARL